MKQSDFAPMFPEVWGASADAQYIQFPIPSSTTITGRASLDLGFPPSTMTPPEAGGAYPFGADVNGGFRMCSTSARNFEGGIIPPYSSSYAQEIGGYPQGARVADATTLGSFWISTADDNLTTPGASGASWVSLFAPVQQGRLLNVQMITASQAYAPTTGATYALCDMVSGGGGGGGAPGANDGSKFAAGTGGQAGSWLRFRIAVNQIAGLYITIGVGGAGGASGQNGGTGGDTSFGSFYRVYGGPGGQGGTILSAPGAGLVLASSQAAPVGNTIASALGGGPGSWMAVTGLVGFGSKGGDSHFGPGGYMGPGQSGATYGGAGGSGAGGAGAFTPGNYTNGLPGAAGGSGLVIIYEYS